VTPFNRKRRKAFKGYKIIVNKFALAKENSFFYDYYVTDLKMNSVRVCLITVVISLSMSCSVTKDKKNFVRVEKIVIGLDGVSYSTFLDLQRDGYFADFQPVAPMVATFPSISDPNWNRLTGSEMEESYTKEYFDMSIENKNGLGVHSGSLLKHLITSANYQRAFNVLPKTFFQHVLNTAWFETSAYYWLDVFADEILNSDPKSETLSALIVNTDFIAHTQGEDSLKEYLKEVSVRLTDLIKKSTQRFQQMPEFVLVSDHGNDFVTPQPIRIENSLEKLGWNKQNHLRSASDYAYVSPEILTFAAFYSLPKNERTLALAIGKTPGVEFSIYKSADGFVHILGDGNESEFKTRLAGSKIYYKKIKGKDLLGLSEIFKKTDTVDKADFFNKTLHSPYPYSLVRIWEAFYENSKQHASVIATSERGFAFFNPTLEAFTKIKGLRSQHGSLRSAESLGIVVSNRQLLPSLTPEQFAERYPIKKVLHTHARGPTRETQILEMESLKK